ncbi:hypothetical protein SBV1_2300033 [Verrucomicrobia bacterium]|nr:hypothetical protein SBV1_2300033 [Verrucomicrobiota bacterium]
MVWVRLDAAIKQAAASNLRTPSDSRTSEALFGL